MRLTVRLLDIPKLDDLIEDNEFIRKVLKPDPYGGWHIVADAKQMKVEAARRKPLLQRYRVPASRTAIKLLQNKQWHQRTSRNW